MKSSSFDIRVADDKSVSAILEIPQKATHLLVLAHGAGAGMEHRNMQAIAAALHEEKVATMRYNFLYMEEGRRAPDRPPKAIAVIEAALKGAKKKSPLPILVGGKSFGGRMSSTAASQGLLEAADGLVFYGWPLHAPGKEGTDRAAHLSHVKAPMLFLQGTRDTLAKPELMQDVYEGLKKTRMVFFEGADHSFHVLKRSGRTDAEVNQLLASTVRQWLDSGLRGGLFTGR